MDKRVLIFFPHNLKQRHGGPYSMLYHLQRGLKSTPNEIHFLSSLIQFPEEVEHTSSNRSSFLKKLKRLAPKRWIYDYRIANWVKAVSEPNKKILSKIDVSHYDVLHFHETIDLWRYRSLIEKFRGAIILTSHSPKPYHLEHLEDVMGLDKTDVSTKSFKAIEKIDEFAYSKATHLVFPCKEATESYFELWPAFKAITQAKQFYYIATGVVRSHVVHGAVEIRNKLSIPQNAFVITYVGRKISVKGFDLLLKAAKILLEPSVNLYFLIVGKKNDAGLNHERWIETGWSDDPFSYVAAGDLHVVPNRYTNFDLNVLEVLSLGKPLLLSNTGGNKFFKQFNPEGIFYHEPNEKDLVDKIQLLSQKQNALKEAGVTNQDVYSDHFNAERFAKDHLQFYNSLK